MIFLDVCHGIRFLCHGLQSPQDYVPNSVSYPGNVSQCTRLKAPRIDLSGFENQTSCSSFFLHLLFLLLVSLSSFCMGHSIYWESVKFLLSETSEQPVLPIIISFLRILSFYFFLSQFVILNKKKKYLLLCFFGDPIPLYMYAWVISFCPAQWIYSSA